MAPSRFAGGIMLIEHHGRLKGVDAPRAAALRAVTAELDCEIFLALADVHETWAYEEEDSGYLHYAAKGFGDYDDEDEVDEVVAVTEPSINRRTSI